MSFVYDVDFDTSKFSSNGGFLTLHFTVKASQGTDVDDFGYYAANIGKGCVLPIGAISAKMHSDINVVNEQGTGSYACLVQASGSNVRIDITSVGLVEGTSGTGNGRGLASGSGSFVSAPPFKALSKL